LIIVPTGPLATLPFGVLVTQESRDAFPEANAGYRDAAWLVRDHAITVLPSIASLAALRAGTNKSTADQPFIAFGNPLLEGGPDKPMEAQRAELARRWQHCSDIQVQPETIVHSDQVLSVSAADDSFFRGPYTNLIAIRAQSPLPETAQELCAVARELGLEHADVDRVVYLGERATETAIKSLNEQHELEQYRVVQFATHGVLAGAWRGLAEPGLILTPPADTTDPRKDDGYLSVSEIAGLQLNADWVVLSACNTAAGETGNAEALSGLTRAFFYARARAVLVSHWAVRSSAAVKLTTGAFRELQAEPAIGRAEALRRSMIALIDDTTQPNAAHPSIWAPFILVGEGSR
jgi:CHAT domain-containing protein